MVSAVDSSVQISHNMDFVISNSPLISNCETLSFHTLNSINNDINIINKNFIINDKRLDDISNKSIDNNESIESHNNMNSNIKNSVLHGYDYNNNDVNNCNKNNNINYNKNSYNKFNINNYKNNNSNINFFSFLSNKTVFNLSSFSFDQHVFSLLEKGLNFFLVPKKIPNLDIICDIEYGIRDLPDTTKDIIRQDCAMVLRKAKPPKSNISKLEFEALKSLNNNHNIVVLKADKGGATVILNKDDYHNKMLDHLLNSRSYKKLDKNPLKKV